MTRKYPGEVGSEAVLQKTQAGQAALDHLRPHLFNCGHIGGGLKLPWARQISQVTVVCQLGQHWLTWGHFGSFVPPEAIWVPSVLCFSSLLHTSWCEETSQLGTDHGGYRPCGSVWGSLWVSWLPCVLCISSLPHTGWCGKASQLWAGPGGPRSCRPVSVWVSGSHRGWWLSTVIPQHLPLSPKMWPMPSHDCVSCLSLAPTWPQTARWQSTGSWLTLFCVHFRLHANRDTYSLVDSVCPLNGWLYQEHFLGFFFSLEDILHWKDFLNFSLYLSHVWKPTLFTIAEKKQDNC